MTDRVDPTGEQFRYWYIRLKRMKYPDTLGEVIDMELAMSSDVALEARKFRRGSAAWRLAKDHCAAYVAQLRLLGDLDTPRKDIEDDVYACSFRATLEVQGIRP